MYSGHEWCHGIKFQSVVTPDGLFASMYGLVSGNRHDSFLLSNSCLLNKLQEFMPDDVPEDIVAVIYIHCMVPQFILSEFIFWGDAKILMTALLILLGIVKAVRVHEVVEWGFANIPAQWSFLDFRVATKIFQSPVSKYLIVAILLVNIQTCFTATKP